MRTTAILNLKGGVAKTTTAVNMAAILARDYNSRVLLIDADSQALAIYCERFGDCRVVEIRPDKVEQQTFLGGKA